jgi:hypothetical protein
VRVYKRSFTLGIFLQQELMSFKNYCAETATPRFRGSIEGVATDSGSLYKTRHTFRVTPNAGISRSLRTRKGLLYLLAQDLIQSCAAIATLSF